jgi:hypothetical protein
VLEVDEGMSMEDREAMEHKTAALDETMIKYFQSISSEERRELFKQSDVRKLLWQLDHMEMGMRGMTLEDRREVLNAMIETIRSHRLFNSDYKA